MKKIFSILLVGLILLTGCTSTQTGFDKSTMISRETGTKFDSQGYDYFGYDANGYDRYGFNRSGINKETGSKFNVQGFNQSGFDKDGFNRQGFNKEGYDREGNIKTYQVKFITNITADGIFAPYCYYKDLKIDGESKEINAFMELSGQFHKITYIKYNKNGYGYHLNANQVTKEIDLEKINSNTIELN